MNPYDNRDGTLRGVYYHITGATAEEVFTDAVSRISLPAGVSPDALLTGLMERERLMSTSIGYGWLCRIRGCPWFPERRMSVFMYVTLTAGSILTPWTVCRYMYCF